MEHLPSKLENPERLAELRPAETLREIGLGKSDVFCDIGAGSGVFTIPAAKLTSGTVFALDIDEEALRTIAQKAQHENLPHIKTLKVAGERYEIEDASVDLVLMSAVLHDMDNPTQLFREIKRICKSGGKLAVIEFHDRRTPMGPPVSRRIGKEAVISLCGQYGLSVSNEFDLGENYYCVVFEYR